MRVKILALEGLDDTPDAADPLNTDKTIEAPVADEDTPVNPDETPVEDTDVTKDEPEIPIIGELKVDEVHEEEVEATQDAIDTTKELVSVAEHLATAIENYGKIDKTAAAVALSSLQYHRNKLMFKQPMKTSMESFDDTKSSSVLVLESFMDTIKNVLKAVINTIKNFITWLLKTIKNFFIGVKTDITYNRKIATMVLNQRKNKADKLVAKTAFNPNEKHWIASPNLANKLFVSNKLPDDLSVEFKNIQYLLDPKSAPSNMQNYCGVKTITEVFNKDFLNGLENIIDCTLVKTEKPVLPLKFNPVELFTPDTNPVPFNAASDVGNPVDKAGKLTAKSLNKLYPQALLLGGKAVVHEFSNNLNPSAYGAIDSLGMLKVMQDWTIHFEDFADIKMNDGWFRFISTKEIEETNTVVNSIFSEVVAMEGQADKVVSFQTDLQNILNKASNLNFEADSLSVRKTEIVTQLANVINNIIKVSKVVTVDYMNYARVTCNAWSLLLKEIYLHEEKLSK